MTIVSRLNLLWVSLAVLLAPTVALNAQESQAPGTPRWAVRLHSQVRTGIVLAPDGTIHCGTDNGRLWAITPQGNIRWSFSGTGQLSEGLSEGPVVHPAGGLVAGMTSGFVHRLDSDGRLLWERNLGAQIRRRPTVSVEGFIIVHDAAGNLWCLDSEGEVRWVREGGWDPLGEPVIGLEGVLVTGRTDSTVVGMNLDGEELWQLPLERTSAARAVSGDGTFLLSALGGHGVYAVSSQGELLWSRGMGGNVYFETPFLLGSNGLLRVAASFRSIHGLNSEGVIQWTRQQNANEGSATLAGDSTSVHLLGTGNILVLDENGDEVRTVQFPVSRQVSPVLSANRLLVYAFNGSSPSA